MQEVSLPGEVPCQRPDRDGLTTSSPLQAQLTRLLVLQSERFFEGMQTVESLFLLITFQDSKVDHHSFFPSKFFLSLPRRPFKFF